MKPAQETITEQAQADPVAKQEPTTESTPEAESGVAANTPAHDETVTQEL